MLGVDNYFVQKHLKDQWIERIQQFLPDAKPSIQGPLIDIENKDSNSNGSINFNEIISRFFI